MVIKGYRVGPLLKQTGKEVLSDNVLTLFVFWELTGFTSFLLIGFEHQRAGARAAARQKGASQHESVVV